MFGGHFYWASIRKINAVFGNMFNDISIQRVDEADNLIKTFVVPIEQAQKQHYLVRLYEESKKEDSPGIGITLPRMSYEFVGMAYEPSAKLQTSRYLRTPKTVNDDSALKMWNPVPYTLSIDLNLYTKTFDEAFQILEQILPYFGPHIGLTINEIPEMGLTNDITIQLDGFDTGTEYEGNIGDNRVLQWTLNFSVATRLFHPTQDAALIKKVIENIHTNFAGDPSEKTVQIITQVVNPITADENDVYTIDKTIQEF